MGFFRGGSRRGPGAALALISIVGMFWLAPVNAGAKGLVDLVNPFVGTDASAPDFGTGGGAGNTFPGATLPFGMAVFGPDTIPSSVNFTSGYTYSDDQIRGFPVTDFSGAGCALHQDVPILPVAGALSRSPVVAGSADLIPEIVPGFDHRRESASPGYYEVTLDPDTGQPIRSQLTATTRNAVGRFTFAGTKQGTVIVNAGGSTMANYVSDVKVDPASREISGSSTSGRFCWEPSKYELFFAAKFSRPFESHGTWTKDVLAPGSNAARDEEPNASNYKPIAGGPPFPAPGNPSGTSQAGGYVTFDTTRDRAVEVKIGISYVSVEQARLNLRESRGKDLARIRSEAKKTWSRALSSARIEGGRRDDRRTFATALYHSLLEPSVQSDVNGKYRGQDLKVHVARNREHYSDISGWDVYRSQIPLLAMIKPKRASDIAQSLVAMARQGGCLPRWPYATQNANIMNGDPSSPMIATSYALGARGFDVRAALKAMVKGADEPCHSDNADYTEREALDDYLRLGWIPQERNINSGVHSIASRSEPWGTASTTLEYALADFTISRLAKALGRKDLAGRFLGRSANWRNLVNPASRAIEPRLGTGEFLPGTGPETEDGFVEGSAAQYGWAVPQNLAGLFESMGGRKAALARLDHFFTELNAGPASEHAFLGNEPTIQTPWIYNWLGHPSRAQGIVSRAQIGLYGPTPGGIPGNDDGGTMSAWWVLSALGLSPPVAGTDLIALGSPLFKSAEIRLPRGRLTMSAPRASRGTPYVRSLTLNGKRHPKSWLNFRKIAGGGKLEWDLAAKPTRWGHGAAKAPPSFGK